MATSITACELRILMFGKNQKEKTTLHKLITGKKDLPFGQFAVHRERKLTVVETPNVLSLPVNTVIPEIKKSVALCHPGPNILLLLVNPSDFTERDRHRFNILLKSFGEDALKHLLIIITQNDIGNNSSVRKLTQGCRHRQHKINLHAHILHSSSLIEMTEKLENMVRENGGRHLNFTEETDPMEEFESLRHPLSVVLCGRHEAMKTLTANTILGQKRFHQSCVPECIKKEGKVCGWWVSLVKLPPLYGASKETAAKESSKCITLCDGPEGINAFTLVLPLKPPSEEDKKELEIIQKTFSATINDLTVILLAAEGEPDPAWVGRFLQDNAEIQQLIQSCGGRCIVFNIRDEQQVSRVLQTVESMGDVGGRTFIKEKVLKPQSAAKHVAFLKKDFFKDLPGLKSNAHQSRECIRMVLVGKTGCGKSASANTILGRECFHSEVCSSSLTTLCQKETGDIDGQPISVVDTPGLFDTTLSNDEIKKELLKCISLSAPGPHVFLLVLQIGRFTPEEKETVSLIQQFFGKRSGNFTIILFTNGDTLKSKTLERFVEQDKEGSMKKLINDCGGRCHTFNNNDKKNRSQVKELLKKVESMVKKNGGGYYTTEMFHEAEAAIQKEQKRIMKEKEPEMSQKQRDLERQYQEEMHKRKEKISQLLPEFDDKDERVKLLKEKEKNMKTEKEKRTEEMREKLNQKRHEEIQRQKLEQKVETLEEQIKCLSETAVAGVAALAMKTQEDTKNERKVWEQERKEMCEKQYHEIEQKLQKEEAQRQGYEQECKNYENEIIEAKIRREQGEKQLKELQKSFEMKVDEMRRINEAQARKQAEESNDFIAKYTLRQRRQQEKMISQLCKTKANKRSYDELKKTQEEEMNELKSKRVSKNILEKEINELKKIHEEEIIEWIDGHVKQATERKTCTIS